jgi:isochorismate synthase
MLLADHDGARAVISTWVRPADDRDAIIVGLSSELSALPRTTSTRPGQAQVSAPSVGRNAWVSLESEDSWAARVGAACELISRGALSKIVLARAIRMKAPRGSTIDVARTLTQLAEQHVASTCFVIGNDDGSFFLGATPETLAAVRDGWLETHALAGTAPRGTTHREDEALAQALIASAKNREEHDVVAQALRERLAARCTALEARDHEPRLVKLTRVQHLETTLRGKLVNETHLLTLVDELHPTPAVGGFPTVQAMHYLAESEPLDRGWYSGALGFVDARGEGTLVVGIRSLMVRGDTAWAFAGGGIVAASNARDEWRETELKFAGITDALTLESSDFEARPDDRPHACAP